MRRPLRKAIVGLSGRRSGCREKDSTMDQGVPHRNIRCRRAERIEGAGHWGERVRVSEAGSAREWTLMDANIFLPLICRAGAPTADPAGTGQPYIRSSIVKA